MKVHNTFLKNSSKRFTALLLMATVSAASLQPALASRKSQAQNAKEQAQSNLESTNEKINSIASRQQELQKEINALDSELVDLLVNMDILSDELDQKDEQIKQADKNLEAAKEKENTQYERMKKRIRYMYERGDSSILEALLGATSMADFLNRVNYCNKVHDYDREQLQEYKDTKQKVKDLKIQLEEEHSELEVMQQNYKDQEKDLKKMVASKKAVMTDFDSQLAQAKVLAAAYKETIQEQNQVIRDEEEKERIAAQKEAERRAEAERLAREAAEEAARTAARQAAQASSSSSSQSNSSSQNSSTIQNNNTAQNNSTTPDNTASSGNSGSTRPSSSSTESSSSQTSQAVSPTGATGSDVIAYATQFIGNPYVWGGTSLTNGADCSGFVMSVYAHFGYSLPHSAEMMAGCGRGVSYSEAQPGDLICYSGHVALYMGGGQIVGAQSTRSGITTQTATYRTIIAVRRIIN